MRSPGNDGRTLAHRLKPDSVQDCERCGSGKIAQLNRNEIKECCKRNAKEKICGRKEKQLCHAPAKERPRNSKAQSNKAKLLKPELDASCAKQGDAQKRYAHEKPDP